MKYIVETSKSVEQALADLQAAAVRNKFDILHVHDLRKAMEKNEADFPNACHVLEIAHSQSIKDMLLLNMELNLLFPYRISVYSENGKTKIGIIQHTAILKILSDSLKLIQMAQETEASLMTMIDESA